MSYRDKMIGAGLCDAPQCQIAARKLLGTVCTAGGARCPLFRGPEEAGAVLDLVQRHPAASLRLVSDADCIPHYTTLEADDYVAMDREGVLNRARDLRVLQRLGLAPGDTRRARYLYQLLLERVETPQGICASNNPGWEGCPLARSGAYESVRALGWKALVHHRPEADMAEARRLSVERVRGDRVLRIRPHHFMCMACWVGTTGGEGDRPDDTLDELYRRILRDPDLEVVLVEGNCEACHCCDGFDPQTTRCVHPGGLIRDYLKDLEVFQRLGMMPGDRINARVLLRRLFACVTSTTQVCGYGDGRVTSREWSVCGGPTGDAGYTRMRETWNL